MKDFLLAAVKILHLSVPGRRRTLAGRRRILAGRRRIPAGRGWPRLPPEGR